MHRKYLSQKGNEHKAILFVTEYAEAESIAGSKHKVTLFVIEYAQTISALEA